jgi:hypothetical protein
MVHFMKNPFDFFDISDLRSGSKQGSSFFNCDESRRPEEYLRVCFK